MPYVKVKDLEMFYENLGVGDVIVFLHSAYSRGILAFASQMLDFQRQYDCYFPDFRGHGRTKRASLEWNTPQIADDIVEFMNQRDIGKAYLIGYSLGANVGLYIAVNNPERVATLTTIGTTAFAIHQVLKILKWNRLLEMDSRILSIRLLNAIRKRIEESGKNMCGKVQLIGENTRN